MEESKGNQAGEGMEDRGVTGRRTLGAVNFLASLRRFWSRLSMTEKISLPALAAMLLLALFLYLGAFSGWSTFSGRHLDKNLPWQGESLVIDHADGVWKSSEGNARMALRAAMYPTLLLRASRGEGALLVRFADSRGYYVGDAVNVTFSGGRFSSRDIASAKCNGAEALVFCEEGFRTEADYKYHVLQDLQPFWTATVWERRKDRSLRLLGRVTVTPQ